MAYGHRGRSAETNQAPGAPLGVPSSGCPGQKRRPRDKGSEDEQERLGRSGFPAQLNSALPRLAALSPQLSRGVCFIPENKVIERACRDAQEGKSPSTQA